MVDIGIRILGESASGTRIAGGAFTVENLPAGQVLVLSRFQMLELPPGGVVRDCAGTVVLEDVLLATDELGFQLLLDVRDCADVRLHRSTVFAFPGDNGDAGGDSGAVAVRVTDSRLEVVQSTLTGGGGVSWCCSNGSGGIGGAGLDCAGASRVHVALSDVRGGNGGALDWPFSGSGGDGAPGIQVRDRGPVRQHLRQEPGAVVPHAGIRAGGAG